MKTVVITGANRGIGLELTRIFLSTGKYAVIAGCRNPEAATELTKLGEEDSNLEIKALDVTDQKSAETFAQSLEGKPVDVLINNAGIYVDKGKGVLDADFEAWEQTYLVNVISPFRMIKVLLDNLEASDQAKILTISSQMGSMSLPYSASHAYCSSKAAVNKGMQGVALELKPKGIAVAVAHPGWVQTDMGGTAADITPAESASGLYKVVEKFSLADTGSFYKWNGEIHPW